MSDIPEERTYYLRIILMCMDLTKETVLKVFRYLIKSEDIAKFLASVDTISKLKDLSKNKILNKTEYNLVCSYCPNPEKFDIALLIRLIFGLCRNEIARPQLGWTTKPHRKDESLGADLIRLRDIRNKLIGHRADAKLSKAEYEKIKDKVHAILVRVIENVDPSSKEDVQRRIDEYTKLVVDTENTRVKRYLDQFLEYKKEFNKLQDKAEEESKRSREFQVYFETTPERYVRYIKLLFDGGRLVLCGILERELNKHGNSLVSLLSNNREILQSKVDTQYESHLFPLDPGKMDHTSWDVDLLASVILLVFPKISADESRQIELIKSSRLCYADNALRSLDADDFLSVLTDLISSLNFLSMNIAEEKKLEVWSLIERHKKKNDDGDADEYLDQLRKSGLLVKTLKDIHQETVVRLRQLLRKLDETGINFKAEHDLEIKILTTCQNEEIKKNAEDFLETNLQASFYESDLPANLIRTETDKLVASFNIHPDVKPAGVKRSCILLSFKSSSPSGLIHILDYCESHHFKARLHNISNELHYLFEDTFLLQGYVTLESLSTVIQNVDNTEDESYQGLSIPLKCSSVDGVRYVLDTLKNEKTTNRLNIIAEKISVELKETVSINMTPDLLDFRDVFDETDSEGSGSGGTDVYKAEDIYSTEKELENQKLDTNMKALDHSPTICTLETEKSTCEQEEDSTFLPDSEGSDSGGIGADEKDRAGDRYSSEKEREKLDAKRKAAEHPTTICTDETEKSTCEQDEDSTLLPDSEGSGSSGIDAEKADKVEDTYSSDKGLITRPLIIRKRWDIQRLFAQTKEMKVRPSLKLPDLEAEFVGRENHLQKLQNAWKNHKIFGIFGLRSVGKSRFVKEFWSRKKTEGFELIHIDMKLISDTISLYANIYAALGIESEIKATDPDRWIHHICEALKTRNGKHFFFFFDNTSLEFKGVNIRDSFLSLCTSLVRLCKNVKVFITSTTRVQLPHLRRVYCSHHLLPLKRTESRQLLKCVTQGIEDGEYEDSIVNLSEGLPSLILMIGSALTDVRGLITPKYVVEVLITCRFMALSREFYRAEYRVADDIYKNFIDHVHAVFNRRLTVLEFLDAEQAEKILDSNLVATVIDQTLIPILRRYVLNYDSEMRNFSIRRIIREFLETIYIVRNIPEIRARYCRIFAAVMQNISVGFGTVEYTQTLAAFAVEQPNLQKLLTEVNYTRQNTYQFFIEMATKCTDQIERYMAGEGEDFYQGCLRAADLYGQKRDKAMVNLAVGSMYTNTKGYLSRGADYYESALRVLEIQGRSLQLATVYQRLGWNMLLQARNLDANRYFQKSLAISLVSGEEFKPISLQSMSSMGVSLTQLGIFDDSERYFFACLKRRLKTLGENHPSVGACYNNIGVVYEQKGDAENAFKYYKKGLEVKVKSPAPVMSIVFSLSNAANLSSSMGNYLEALRLIDDALKRLTEEKIPPREALARTYDTKGKIYLREGKFTEAEEMFQKAVDIRKEIAKTMPYLESVVHLADVNRRSGNFERSLSIAKQGLKLKTKATASMPQNTLVAQCLACIADVYDRTNNIERHRETLEKIESEL